MGSFDSPSRSRPLDVAPHGPDGGSGRGSVDGSWYTVDQQQPQPQSQSQRGPESYTRQLGPGQRLNAAAAMQAVAGDCPPEVQVLLAQESRRALLEGTVGDPLLTAGVKLLDAYSAAPRGNREKAGHAVINFCEALADLMPDPVKTRAVADSTRAALVFGQGNSPARRGPSVHLPGE